MTLDLGEICERFGLVVYHDFAGEWRAESANWQAVDYQSAIGDGRVGAVIAWLRQRYFFDTICRGPGDWIATGSVVKGIDRECTGETQLAAVVAMADYLRSKGY